MKTNHNSFLPRKTKSRARLMAIATGACAFVLAGCGDRERDIRVTSAETTTPATDTTTYGTGASGTASTSAASTTPSASASADASLQSSSTAPSVPAGATQKDSAQIVLHEEQLDVKKRSVDAGGVLVSKDVVTEQVEVPVQVQRERVEVTHVSPEEAKAAGATQAGAAGEPFTEKQVYIPLEREEAVVQKDVEVKDVINVDTKTETEQQTVQGTVRREVADIERQGAAETDMKAETEMQTAATGSARTGEFAASAQTSESASAQDQQNQSGQQSQQDQQRLEQRIREDLRNAESIALSDEQIGAITILTRDNMVILQGSVPSEEISQQIEQRIRQMDNNQTVQNRLRVEQQQMQAAE